MSGPLYLSWQYLVRHRGKTAILVASIAIIAFLPVGLNVLVGQSAQELTSRAQATPLVVGARGSPLELTLSTLYFDAVPPAPTRWAQRTRVADSGLADAIPIHARFSARGHRIVGTTLSYFEFRGLTIAAGRQMAVLGECVLGAEAARDLGLAPGDTLVSSPETVFDLAGAYPLRMHVVGVLSRAHTPDDTAIFVDVKTAWIIEGVGHGHQDLSAPEADAAVLSRQGDRITANASVVEFAEITAENLASFHFHGDLSDHPLSAVIAVPQDEKSRVLLLGRYEGAQEAVQIVRPDAVIEDLLGTVFTIRSYVIAAIGLVALATLSTAALVFLLSLRLRRREIETMHKIGAARSSVATLLSSEVVVVLAMGTLLAAILTLVTSRLGSAAIRGLLIS